MKKLLLGFLTALMFSVPVFAHPPITVYVDGAKLDFDQPPIIKEGRTLVPMRKIFEALGAEVIWDETARSVTAFRDTDVIALYIDQAELYKNGQVIYTMPVPAQIINERALVPLRAVAESLGADVLWDGNNYVVDITSAEKGGNETSDISLKDGFSAMVKAPDGTVVLNVHLKCDEITNDGAGIHSHLADEVYSQGQSFLLTYGEKAKAEYAADPNGFLPYYYTGTYRLTGEQGGYVSFLASAVSYCGGAEEMTYTSHTYDLSTGKEVELHDLVSDTSEELEYLWQTSFAALIDTDPGAFYDNAKKRLEKDLEQVGFYLTKNGIVFYLPPDTIAPPETGMVSFEIAYEF